MIKLEKISNKNICKFSIDGSLDEESTHKFIELLKEQTKDNQKIKFLGVIKEFPSIENFATIKEIFKLKIEAIKGAEKYAILTDKDWLEKLVPIANFMTPNMPIKVFETDEEEKAIKWLDADFNKTIDEDDYLTEMNITNIPDTNIYSYTMDNEIDEAGMIALQEIIKNKSKYEKINLLVTINEFPDFDSFKSFYEGLKVKFLAFGHIHRYAIVSDNSWIHQFISVASFLAIGIEIKHFESSKKEEAIDWLKH